MFSLILDSDSAAPLYFFAFDTGETACEVTPGRTTVDPSIVTCPSFRALLENVASFYGAQMTAMDNATRNAGEMIRKQTLTYNRTRQAMITKELIEIISGAEAL